MPRRAPARPSTGVIGFTGGTARLSGRPSAEHAHVEIELNLLLGKGMRYLFAGGAVAFPPGRWIAYWAALPHGVIEVDGECELLWATVPVATFLGWDQPLAQRLLRGELVAAATPAAEPAAVAQQRIAWLRSSDGARRRIAELELEAVARRLALEAQPLAPALGAARSSPGPGATTAVETMAAWLAANYREEIDVAACAAAAGLHPTYAMAQFRRATGTTIWNYLTRLRLAHAQRLLLTTSRAVLDIALDAGFGSQARFYVAFKRAHGTSPAAFRRGRLGEAR